MSQPTLGYLLEKPYRFLAFGYGSGLAPKAPGTFGTLAAVPLFVLMAAYLSLPVFAVITLLVCLVGIPICGKTAEDLGVHDHGGIVWDEFAGYFITMLPIVAIGRVDSVQFWMVTLFGFVVFRFFDVIKPWPIKWFDQHVDGGLGIMIDDIIAGMFSLAVVQIALYFGVFSSF